MVPNWPTPLSDRRFHYCGEARARSVVVDSEVPEFMIGDGGNHFGDGLYCTDMEPSDLERLEQVVVDCFEGGRTIPGVSFVLVFEDVGFERVDTAEWVLPAGPAGDRVYIDALIIEIQHWDGACWALVGSWDGSDWDLTEPWTSRWSSYDNRS